MKLSIRNRALAFVVVLVAAAPLGLLAQRGGFGGPMQQERKVLAQFDKNGDKRLDTAERKAAREWLATQPAAGFGSRRGGPFGGGAASPAEPGRRLTPADVKAYPNAPVYDPNTIRTLFLQFEASDWEKELAAFNNTDVDVPANATIDGKTYKDVGIHFRGMSSYFMVPEGRKLFQDMSVEENLVLGGIARRSGPWTIAKVLEAFPNLVKRRHAKAATLSGGEQQATAIGRALMSNPDVLMLDEISLGLSPAADRYLR